MNEQNPVRVINGRQRQRRVDTEEKLIGYIKQKLGEPMIVVDVTDAQILRCIDDAFTKWKLWSYGTQEEQAFVIQFFPGVRDYQLDDRIRSIRGISIADNLGATNSGGNGSIGGISMMSLMPPMYMPYINAEGLSSSLETYSGSGTGYGSVTGVAGGVAGPHTGAGAGAGAIEASYARMVNMQQIASMLGHSVAYDYNQSNKVLRFFDDHGGSLLIDACIDYIPNPDYDLAYDSQFIKDYSTALVKKQWGTNVGKFSAPLVGGATINYQDMKQEAEQEIQELNQQLVDQSEAFGVFSG